MLFCWGIGQEKFFCNNSIALRVIQYRREFFIKKSAANLEQQLRKSYLPHSVTDTRADKVSYRVVSLLKLTYRLSKLTISC